MDMDSVKKQIENDVKNNAVILYMKGEKNEPMCRYSAAAVQMLLEHGVDFETRDVLGSDTLRQAIKEYSNWPTLPQLYVHGEFVGGADIMQELHESGELKALLTRK